MKEPEKARKDINSVEIIKEERDAWFAQFLHAQKRQNETSDRFLIGQMQVAGVALALSGIMIPFVVGEDSSFFVFSFLISMIFLFTSLVFGLWEVRKFFGRMLLT